MLFVFHDGSDGDYDDDQCFEFLIYHFKKSLKFTCLYILCLMDVLIDKSTDRSMY